MFHVLGFPSEAFRLRCDIGIFKKRVNKAPKDWQHIGISCDVMFP